MIQNWETLTFIDRKDAYYMSHMIELKKVSKFYATKDTVSTGFTRVDLTLDIGEFVAITGESGSGKSTLINVISGLDSYEEGTMFVNGEDTSGYVTADYERYRKQYIGNIFQDYNLIGSYTVYQNIELAMLLAGKSAKECKARIKELIDLVDLNEYTKVKVSKLSGGQKQRVAIARALSKDSPIIVADEPTGNLDSASAAKVMETLGKISKDKLVVIVTHNYEQVEPYVTRKITMHDGRIIEDKKVAHMSSEETAYESLGRLAVEHPESCVGSEGVARDAAGFYQPKETSPRTAIPTKSKSITAGSQMRLGLRNTFNLPTKFLLLLLVYIFVSGAVLSEYASTKNALFEAENLGYNWYFTNTSPDRIILTKQDGTAFDDEDFEKISSNGDVKTIVQNDILLDSACRLRSNEHDAEGAVLPIECADDYKLKFGRLPEADYEMLLVYDENTYEHDYFSKSGDEMIDKSFVLDSAGNSNVEYGTRVLKNKVKIVGIAKSNKTDNYQTWGNVKFYTTQATCNRILVKYMAALSDSDVTINDKKVSSDGMQMVFSSDMVPKGEVYVFEEKAYQFHDEGKILGKEAKIKISNINFESEGKFKVGAIVKESTLTKLLGYKKSRYYDLTNQIYINSADYDKLIDKGTYQSSIFVKDASKNGKVVKAMNDMGYDTFVIRDSLITGGDVFVKIISLGTLILELMLLFFVAYAVIRLIMRSRNSYYSTLRILGANRAHTGNVLRIELCTMMAIAYGIVAGAAYLVQKKIIDVPNLYGILGFVSITDYAILLVALLVMSLLIAGRYSRKLFGNSAMNVYREEV